MSRLSARDGPRIKSGATVFVRVCPLSGRSTPIPSHARRRGPACFRCRRSRWRAGRTAGLPREPRLDPGCISYRLVSSEPCSFPRSSLAPLLLPRLGWGPSRRPLSLRPPLPQAEAAPHPTLSRRERVFRGARLPPLRHGVRDDRRMGAMQCNATEPKCVNPVGSEAGATPAFARAGGWGNATPRHRVQMCESSRPASRGLAPEGVTGIARGPGSTPDRGPGQAADAPSGTTKSACRSILAEK